MIANNIVNAKKELLADNLAGETLTEAQETFNQAKTALGNKFNEVKGTVETALNNVENMVDDVESMITSLIQSIPGLAETLQTQIDTKVNEALATLKTEFATGDLAQYNISFWTEQTPAA